MKKYTLIFILLLVNMIMFINPKEVLADNSSNYNTNIILLNNDVAEEVCTGLLGEHLKKDLENILKIMRIVAPIIVIFLTTAELISAVASKDDNALNKAMSKLTTRIALVAVLFFLPILLNLLLGFIDNKYSTCIK